MKLSAKQVQNSFTFSSLDQIYRRFKSCMYDDDIFFSLSLFVHRTKDNIFLTSDNYRQNLKIICLVVVKFNFDVMKFQYHRVDCYICLCLSFSMRYSIKTPPLIKCSIRNCDEIQFKKNRYYSLEFVTDSDRAPTSTDLQIRCDSKIQLHKYS